MKVQCKIVNLYKKFNADNEGVVELQFNNIQSLLEFEELKKEEKTLDLELKIHKEKRSLNANAYMWKLLSLASEELKVNNEELYKRYVKEYGIYKDIVIEEKGIKTVAEAWRRNGIAWFSEVLDFAQNADFKTLRMYYGTSVYNTKQMTRILNAVVEDCQELGIKTKEDIEIENMLKEWSV